MRRSLSFLLKDCYTIKRVSTRNLYNETTTLLVTEPIWNSDFSWIFRLRLRFNPFYVTVIFFYNYIRQQLYFNRSKMVGLSNHTLSPIYSYLNSHWGYTGRVHRSSYYLKWILVFNCTIYEVTLVFKWEYK